MLQQGNANSGGREKQISVSSQELRVASVAGSVLMREVATVQITKTPSPNLPHKG